MSTAYIKPIYYQKKFAFFFKEVSKYENFLTRKIKIDKPTFIFGSPRSGTSLVTEILHLTGQFATTLHKDFPFGTIPITWNYFNNLYFGQNKSSRAHNPLLDLTKESPDSTEEYLLKYHLNSYNKFHSKFLDQNFNTIEVKKVLDNHIRKTIFLRKKSYYLSKNNNNLLRIKFLKEMYPTARFIFCFRHPILTCLSQAKIHRLFTKSKDEKKISAYLKAIGRYEFSNSFNSFKIGNYELVEALWKKKKFFKAYVTQWQNLNNFVLEEYLNDNKLSQSIICFNFDKYINDYSYRNFFANNLSFSLDLDHSKVLANMKNLTKNNLKKFNTEKLENNLPDLKNIYNKLLLKLNFK